MKPQIIRHGEVILKPIGKIPSKAKLVENKESLIVAHSETGHHHILETKVKDKTLKLFKTDLGEMYLEVEDMAELWHQKTGSDIHTPHKIAPSAYKIVIKKEFDYFQGIIRQVRD